MRGRDDPDLGAADFVALGQDLGVPEKAVRRVLQDPADPALAAALTGMTAGKLLSGGEPGVTVPRDGTYLGALFESLVTLNVRVFAQAVEARVFHLRTRGGEHEVDLIVEAPDGGVVAIEVKLSATMTDVDCKHLIWLRGQFGSALRDAVVVSTGAHAYRRTDGVAVIPACALGP